jgi:phage gp36-like protein
MSYATTADLLKRVDSRVLGDLVSDSNVRVDPTSLLTDANIQAALDDASGLINSAVLVSEKYQPSDLAGLTGVDQAYLLRLTCNLAYGLLVLRRGQSVEKLEQYQEALKTLEMLRSGERVFAVAANEEAGLPQAQFPSAAVYQNLDLMRDKSKVFPTRRSQIVS